MFSIQKYIDATNEERGYLEKMKSCPAAKLYNKTSYAGSDNYTKYWHEAVNTYGLGNYQGGSWCCGSLFEIMCNTYSLKDAQKLWYQTFAINCQVTYEAFKKRNRAFSTPEVGDFVVFWNGSRMHHIELVIYVYGDTYKTNGGNTEAHSAVPNGGGFYGPKTYSISAAKKAGHKFLRPEYGAQAEWVQDTTSGKWQYVFVDGTKLNNGWNIIDGKWYYFEKDGYMKTGWLEYKNQWYYLCESGCMDTGWKLIKKKWYYFDDNGTMFTGWLYYHDRWYYLDESIGGNTVTGLKEINGELYYFDKDGAMYSGQWVEIKNDWYFFTSTGAAAKSRWIQGDDGFYYYVKEDGIMAKDAYVKAVDKNVYYYVDQVGKWQTEKDWSPLCETILDHDKVAQ